MTVTLETLRAEYEAAAKTVEEHRLSRKGCANLGRDCCRELNASRRFRSTTYFIAAQYGLEAAMLYKLSDGAIDPRNEVQS